MHSRLFRSRRPKESESLQVTQSTTWKLHHQGGSISYQNRDYRVGPETPEVIQEDQAFCWNPNIAGTKSEDTILATSRGPEIITVPGIFPAIAVEVDGIQFTRPAILEK